MNKIKVTTIIVPLGTQANTSKVLEQELIKRKTLVLQVITCKI
jgi:hypothetical protein